MVTQKSAPSHCGSFPATVTFAVFVAVLAVLFGCNPNKYDLTNPSPSTPAGGPLNAADSAAVSTILKANRFNNIDVRKVIEIVDSHVVSLYLTYQYGNKYYYIVADTLPPEVANLTALKKLVIQGTLSSLPSTFGNLKALESLVLSNCFFSDFPMEICELTNLYALDLRDNKLVHLPNEISNLKNLVLLSIDRNSLLSLPDSIGGLTSITSISASVNSLESIPPSIGLLSRMERLGLRSNNISTLPEEVMSLRDIKVFNVGDNKICSVSDTLESWLNTYAHDWKAQQSCF